MAAKNGVNYAKEFVNVPSEQAEPGSMGGRVRVLLDYILAGGAVEADVVSIGKLPKGARVLRCSNVGGGTSPSYSVAPMAQMSAETVVTFTVGASPSTDIYVFIEYVLD